MAIGPIDYSGMQQYNDLIGNLQSGAQFGIGMQEARLKQQQLQAAQQAQEQYRADVDAYLQSPTAQGAAALVTKYPQQREAILGGWKALDENQQRDELQITGQVFSALSSGRADIAEKVLDERIAARKNSGLPVAKEEQARELIKSNPEQAKGYLGLVLAQLDDNFAKNYGALGDEQRAQAKAPAELLEANAKASSAATAAKFAESKAVQDLKLGDAQINKWAADTEIARQNSRIAAMNASIAREGNAIKLEELRLKRDEAIQARDDKLRTKVADVEAARATMDNFLNTADQIVNTPLSIIKKSTGTIDSRLPTFDEDAANFEALVETLGSQAFLSQIPSIKGTGALSNAEGEKLQAALQNISLKQTGPRLVANVREAQRLILKARDNLATRYGVPNNMPDRPSVQTPGLPAGFKILGKEQ